MEIEQINKDVIKELFEKYQELIIFMESTGLNVKATKNFLYLNIDQIISS